MNGSLFSQESGHEEENRSGFAATTIVVPAYIGLIGVAEAIGVFFEIIFGTLGHALLILTLLSHYTLRDKAPYRRALPVLALVPLLRILSITVPVRQVPQIYWYAMVSIPLLVAGALTVRLLKLSWNNLGLRNTPWIPQFLIALHGLPLSIAAYLLLKPKPLIADLNWQDVAIASIILIIFTGFTEELIFRGILQGGFRQLFGPTGVLHSSGLFTIMYLGSFSLSYIIFIGLVGLFFGWCVNRTNSIWGVALAHSLLNIGMMLIWPILWQ